ncbi:TPA: TniQ family protein [Pseudomonas aeruginosa]|nr:TniQ family protein [Pseudomonas aeruginosa]
MEEIGIWHQGGKPVEGLWPLTPELLCDEILSSWLVRTALAHCCAPIALTDSVWPSKRFWTRDPDASQSAEDLGVLALHSGISQSALASSSLARAHRLINGEMKRCDGQLWVLGLGQRNRRRAGGLQYCPKCFAEGACFYRIQDRLAWHTCCPKHQCLLADRCPRCRSAVCPQLLVPPACDLDRCHRCGIPFGHDALPIPDSRAFAFQKQAESLSQGTRVLYGDAWVSGEDWLKVARWMIGLLRSASIRMPATMVRFLSAMEVDPGDIVAVSSGLRFELLGPLERSRILATCWPIINAGPERFVRAVRESRLRSSYAPVRAQAVPQSVASLAQAFLHSPRGSVNRAVKGPRSPDSVMKMWQRFLRKSLR